MNFKNSIFVLVFSVFYNICCSQNLVPNPSFEDENVCIKYHENCSPAAWRSTTLKQFLYLEYLAAKRGSNTIVPPDGNRFVGLRVFNTQNKFDRSIIQTPLLCQLGKGKTYQISFDYLSSVFWINELHLQFVDTLKIHKNNHDLLEGNKNNITISFQKQHQQKKWITYKTTYLASGDEVGFIFGNLNSDESTQANLFNKRKDKNKKRAYYYFDNFVVEPIEKDSLCPLEKNRRFIYKDSIRHFPNGKILDVTMQPRPLAKLVAVPKEIITTTEIVPLALPQDSTTEIITGRVFMMKNILFENNSYILLPISFDPLQELISFLKKNTTLQINITGHTDNVGEEMANLKLSEDRAKSVAQFLKENHISPSRIKTMGKGESDPLTTNNTPKGRRQNRRVEFELISH